MTIDNVTDNALTEVLNEVQVQVVAETPAQRFKRLYCTRQLTEHGLNNAVRFNLITAAERDDILAACPGGTYPTDPED